MLRGIISIEMPVMPFAARSATSAFSLNGSRKLIWIVPLFNVATSSRVGLRTRTTTSAAADGGDAIGNDIGAGRAIFFIENTRTVSNATFDRNGAAERNQLLDAGRHQRSAEFARPRFLRHANSHPLSLVCRRRGRSRRGRLQYIESRRAKSALG